MLKPINKKNTAGLMALLGLAVAGCNSNGGGTTTGGTTSASTNIDPSAALATVGGTNISRGEVLSLLEANAGEQALSQLIDYNLAIQEAKSKGIEISEEQVQAEVDRRAATSPAVAEVVKAGGVKLEGLKRQMRYQMALDALLTRDVKVDPKAANAWLAKNRANYDRPAQYKLGILLTSQKARADIMAQQLKNNSKTFLQLVEEQKKAKDPVAQGSVANTSEGGPGGPEGGYLPATQLPKPILDALSKLQPNQNTPVVAIAPPQAGRPGIFAVVQLLDRKPAVTAKATDANVLSEYKLTLAAQNALKKQPGAPKFEQALTQVQQSLAQQSFQTGQAPTYRQALDTLNQGEVQNLLSSLRTKGGVTVSDPQYVKVAEAYKPVPTPAPVGGASTTPGAAGGSAPAGGAESAAPPASAPAAGGAPATGGAPAAPAGGASSGGTP